MPRPSMETAPRVDDVIALPDGRSLAYAEFGDPDGRPVLFLHGTPGYRLNPWTTNAEIRSLDVRLIALDRPGVGRSTPRPQRRLLDWPDDVQTLADFLGLERFAVVGFSNGGPHAAACAYKLAPRVSGTALVAAMPPLDQPGALQQLGVPGWYYPAARRAPWVLRALFGALVALARRNARRAERILLSDMSEPDRRLFGRPEYTGRFGADLVGAGSRGVVDDERVMPLPWGFEPERVEGPVRLWLGERDELVPMHLWLERAGQFPACDTTVVPGVGHFFIAENMAKIVSEV
jgi:pimeloyl-ACP methyl ester carboxylesterase